MAARPAMRRQADEAMRFGTQGPEWQARRLPR